MTRDEQVVLVRIRSRIRLPPGHVEDPDDSCPLGILDPNVPVRDGDPVPLIV